MRPTIFTLFLFTLILLMGTTAVQAQDDPAPMDALTVMENAAEASVIPELDKSIPTEGAIAQMYDVLVSTGNVWVLGFMALWFIALIVVNLTPTPTDNKALGFFYKYVLEFALGLFTRTAKKSPPNKTKN